MSQSYSLSKLSQVPPEPLPQASHVIDDETGEQALHMQALLRGLGRLQALASFRCDGQFLEANAYFRARFGYSLAEISVLHHIKFQSWIDFDAERYRAFWAALNEGGIVCGSFRCVDRDGQGLWLRASYHPWRDQTGTVIKVMMQAIDVSDIVARQRLPRSAFTYCSVRKKKAPHQGIPIAELDLSVPQPNELQAREQQATRRNMKATRSFRAEQFKPR